MAPGIVLTNVLIVGILGGGFLLGSVVMVIEDADAPHHLLLLRSFMSQGIMHRQPLLFAGTSKEPRAFLGTLPSPVSSLASSKEERQRRGAAGADSSAQDQVADFTFSPPSFSVMYDIWLGLWIDWFLMFGFVGVAGEEFEDCVAV